MEFPFRSPPLPKILRFHPRLLLAAALALIVAAVLPRALRGATRLLIGWDIGVGFYLVAVFVMAWGSDAITIRARSAREDEGSVILLMLTVGAALATLGAIIAELGTVHRAPAAGSTSVLLASLTIALSWTFIHTIFALHYAHEFYRPRRGGDGGLKFPGADEPDYWDFVYFSFVVGMTSQVSDVAVTQRRMRRLVAAHGAVSFTYNAALVALSVNIAASLL
jgi:uncharacterized membrane protein